MNFFSSNFGRLRRVFANGDDIAAGVPTGATTGLHEQIVEQSFSEEEDDDYDNDKSCIENFILNIERRWVATRVYEGGVFFGQHASGTIAGKKKPHRVFLTTDEAQLGHWMPPHDIGHQLSGETDRMVIVITDAMMHLVTPGATLKVRTVWSETDSDYEIFEEVTMEVLSDTGGKSA